MKRNDALSLLLNHPNQNVKDAATAIAQEDASRRVTLQLIQDALGQLRLDVAYLSFDLEATRRERDVLKAELGKKP